MKAHGREWAGPNGPGQFCQRRQVVIRPLPSE